MAKLTEVEEDRPIPQKVQLLYQAVARLIEEGVAPEKLRVSTITEKAGIGKGTAYEYFESKEDIVAHAVVYQIQTAVSGLEKGLLERSSFREQLAFLLDEAGAPGGRENCFLKLIHLLTDNSEFSRQVQKIMDSEVFDRFKFAQLFRRILGAGQERGELRRDLPLDYMVYTMGARVLAYMVALRDPDLQIRPSEMRELLYQEILSELCAAEQV